MQASSAEISKTMTVTEAAALLMVSDQWVRDLTGMGFLPKPEGGRIPLVGVVQGYIKWLKDEARRASRTVAQSQVAEARAREIQLRNAKAENASIDREDVEAAFAAIIAIYREELDSVAAVAIGRPAVQSAIGAALTAALDRAQASFTEAIQAARSGGAFKLSERT